MSWKEMRVLVTGGAGFIGSHLVDALVDAEAKVRVFDNLATGSDKNLARSGEQVEFLLGDLRDSNALGDALADGVRVVFHLGALGSVPRSLERPLETHEVNVSGTLNVLEAARRASESSGNSVRVIMASSSSIYGDRADSDPRHEDLPASPRSPYAASKVAGEAYLGAYHGRGQLETTVLRLFNVFGPRQRADSPYAAAIPRFVEAVLAGRPVQVFGDGEQSRDFTFVGDVVDAFLRAGSVAAAGMTCNAGGGRPRTVNDLVAAVAKACDRADGAQIDYRPARPGDVRYSHADATRAREQLGWSARVELVDGLEQVVAHMRGLTRGDLQPLGNLQPPGDLQPVERRE